MVILRRAPGLRVELPELDPAQAAAVAHRGGLLRVLGGPGTGKTTLAVELVVDRVRRDGLRPDQCLLLSPSRLAAGQLRQQVTARLGGTSTESLARTHQALGFGILRQAAALRGEAAPRLLSGPEQDLILRELLAGHALGEGKAPSWPAHVVPALATRGFRSELRDLLMRAVERGLEPGDLAELGRVHERPEWVAAAQVLAEYDEVTAFSRPGAYDPAWILGAAADLLQEDPEAFDRLHDTLRLIVVDDAQELTSAATRLLDVIASRPVDLVLIGDPDVTVQGFRGADPRLFGELADRASDATTIMLGTSYRLPAVLREVADRVTRRIGAVGPVGHRRPVSGPGGRVDVALVRAASQEAALIGVELRTAHLGQGVPWQDMAVIVRGQGRTGSLRRGLTAAGVPVAVAATELPVRDEVAVRPLLALLGVVLRVAGGQEHPVDTETAVDVLSSPIGGADAVALRRLRRALRREELAAGGTSTSDELLAGSILNPDQLALLGPEAAPARLVARAVAAGVEAAQLVVNEGTGARRWAPGVSAETVLWAMWQATGLGPAWARTALGGGASGARADRNLDAVLALFDAAAKYVDRLPQMGPHGFLEHLRGQDVAADTLVARAPSGDAVELVTAQAAAGRQWRFVVVAGVQEGVWPDLRLRGSLLGSERLVDVITGRGQSLRAAQAAVRYDETRQFLTAVTRASERLLVTAVRSEDEQPSVYLDVIDPLDDRSERSGDSGDSSDPSDPSDSGGPIGGTEEGRRFADVPRPMTLPGLVAELRREIAIAAPAGRAVAAAQLARLAAERVPGADPASWWALTTVSDDRPLRPLDAVVTVSPSRIEGFADCGLRWLLVTRGGDGPDQGAANIGTLVHDIAAELGDVDEQTLCAEVEARWGRLGLPSGWVSRKQQAEAMDMVRRLARYYRESRAAGWQRAGVELELSVGLGRALLHGRIDRLETRADGSVRVIDLKTGSAKPSASELPRHPQLGAYQVAVEHGAFPEHSPVSAGAALLQLGKAANAKTTVQQQGPLDQDPDPQWAERLVAETAEGMAGATVIATVGEGCQRCPVRSSCPLQPEGKSI